MLQIAGTGFHGAKILIITPMLIARFLNLILLAREKVILSVNNKASRQMGI